MRCESLQGVWSPEALLVHEVLELLFVDEPRSIWTGASDGKLVRWSLDLEEAWPFALLCGHTHSIVGLATCSSSSSSSGARAVVSVCLDGGICLWDIVTGRCSKRRQLPLSAAHPAAIATVPGGLRCVCVAYNSSSGLEGEANTNSKGGVLLVDVCTFTVLQTLSLGLGPVSAIVATTQGSDHGLVVADTQGRSKSCSGIKLEQEGETGKNPRLHWTPWDLEQGTRAESVALSSSGHYMLLVFRKHWVVGSRQDGSTFSAESECNAGGCFLATSQAQAETRFLVWDVHGGATVYLASHRQSALEVSVLCCIPPPGRIGIGARFCSVGDAAIARVEFGSPAKSSLWGTRVTLWNINTCSEGCLSNQPEATVDKSGRKEELVSTSMVLSNGKCQVPSAIVYGYETGRIQVVELQPTAEAVSKHSLLWHSGPILCLAAHYPDSEQQVLLSGSMDCCVCIWDMKEGSLLTVLHHHIAPVRQLILPSPETIGPWAQCFISVSEDGCVAISSLSSLRAERMFPGHAGTIKRAVWDEARGYLAVLCTAGSGNDLLYIWDVHSGGKERVLRSTAAHSMLKHFLGKKKSMEQATSISTSVSSLLLPYEEQVKASANAQLLSGDAGTKRPPVRGGCPFPGIAAIQLDLSVLLAHKSGSPGTVGTLQEGQLLRTSLSVLHVWGVDELLDASISRELQVYPPKDYQTGAGILGNKGAVSLILPNKQATFELWKVTAEFCSLRVLTMVSLAQLLISISNLGSLICSALATFYSKTIFEKLGASCRPCLEVYIHFWQDPAEHVRLAARTLFHTAAENGVPDLLTNDEKSPSASGLLDWLESMDVPEWAAASGASYQDARAARIVMCGALVVWYPTLVRKDLAEATAPLLLKLVQATSDKHSATAAEILSAGMATTWQPLICTEIPHLVRDVLSLAQCLNTGDDTSSLIRNGLTAFLLPSLAAADVLSFLTAVRSSATTDPSLYLVGLPALVQVVQKTPLVVIPFLGQVVALALQGMSISKPLSLKDRCFFVALQTIRELVRAFPMVALYEDPVSPAAKLAVGDPAGDTQSLAVHVYDIPSGTKLKLLDASGPPGHPALSRGGITAAAFSLDGEGLVTFSHRGLIIRWWSFEGNWWEKLSRGPVLVHCTKVVFVPPSAAFSPRSWSTSVLCGESNQLPSMTTTTEEEEDSLEVDLTFRLQWRSDRVVALHRGVEEVGIFQL